MREKAAEPSSEFPKAKKWGKETQKIKIKISVWRGKKKKATIPIQPIQSPQLPQEQNASVIPANLPLRNSQDLQGTGVTEIPIIQTSNHI